MDNNHRLVDREAVEVLQISAIPIQLRSMELIFILVAGHLSLCETVLLLSSCSRHRD